MPILDGDIKIVASQVLADVPEGGGAATGVEVIDGASNNLFPDVSELDHVYGNAALRKVFVDVQTATTDAYLGAHAIIAEEPADPNVSCVLFSTGDAFDTRASAKNRIESYLTQGTLGQGLLFGDHIQGQMAVALAYREGTPLPTVGETLLLRKNEGLGGQVEQYVRVIDVESAIRAFTDASGDFKRLIATLSISDQLSTDFKGFPALRYDSSVDFTGKTKVYDTNVADASRYYGVKPLLAAASAGDRTVQADGIFVPLVPSSRTEVGIADARMTQTLAGLVPGSDSSVTVNFAGVIFTAASPLFVGGGIMPGTLALTAAGSPLTDLGGTLVAGATTVGTVDYANGIVYLSGNSFGTSGITVVATYRPSGTAQTATNSVGFGITDATRRLTWVTTLVPPPAPGSLQVSYRAQGRWYTLEDDGSGAVRGSDPSLGAGTLNATTGTVNLTLGALPDVPSAIIYSWAAGTTALSVVPRDVNSPPSGPLANDPKYAFPANAAASFEIALPTGVKPGTLSIAWGGLTATDSSGVLIGSAKGFVDYGTGKIQFAPNLLPAKGTALALTYTGAVGGVTTFATLADGGSTWTASVAVAVKPRSFSMVLPAYSPVREYPGTDVSRPSVIRVTDDGSGVLKATALGNATVGTINYATGEIALQKTFSATVRAEVFGSNVIGIGLQQTLYVGVVGWEDRTVAVTIAPGTSATAYFGAADLSGATASATLDTLVIAAIFRSGLDVNRSVAFNLGGVRMTVGTTGTLVELPSKTDRGYLAPASGNVVITSWTTGLTNVIDKWSATQSPLAGSAVDAVMFRTASAPVAPSGFSVTGTLSDGTTFSGNADAAGHINATGVVGVIDYETGVVNLRFGAPTTDPVAGNVVDISALGIPGVTNFRGKTAFASTLVYNAVSYNYLPLDASILGLNPVRLPSDGRVPVFRRGNVVVVHHTAETSPVAVSNGQTINLGRTRVGQVRVRGADGSVIFTGYGLNRSAGTVTFSAVAGYAQPVTIEHRIEEAALCSDAQISGLLRLAQPLSRAYPSGSKVSSALLIGSMFARVSLLFDQVTWNSGSPVWSDDLIGSAAGANYDAINFPPEVKNFGAVTERWALVFTGSTSFTLVGEHLGQIGVYSTVANCAPVNPATGTPYFTLRAGGFNAGWSAGNVIRLNTVGALAPLWLARVVQQGVASVASDKFTLAVRGDVDTP